MMKNNYSFFKYVPEKSIIHNMNSKMKILWCLLSLLINIIMRDYISFFIFILLLIFMIKKSNISIIRYLYNLYIIYPIYIISFIILFLFTRNFSLSLLIVLKIVLTVILFLILTFTTSISEIAWGFECLFIKLKKIGINVSKISLKIAFALKFVSTIFDKAKEVRKSMAYRGVPYRKSKLITFKKMTIPIIKLSYKLSSRTIAAMRLRFYGYSKKRTNYHENKITNFDRLLIVFDIVLFYIVLCLGCV